jgi:hypothetical protein
VTARPAPPIPASCAYNPTTRDGLVVPWVNVRLADGGVDFRVRHRAREVQCWHERLCQVCGDRLRHPALLLGPAKSLQRLVFDEPALHAECARYTAAACSMIRGDMTHYASGRPVSHGKRGERCPVPGCGCEGWVPGDVAGRAGDPAEAWFAVWVRGYSVALHPSGDVSGGVVDPDEVLRVRQLGNPGEGPLCPWVEVTDWRERYTPPTVLPAPGLVPVDRFELAEPPANGDMLRGNGTGRPLGILAAFGDRGAR